MGNAVTKRERKETQYGENTTFRSYLFNAVAVEGNNIVEQKTFETTTKSRESEVTVTPALTKQSRQSSVRSLRIFGSIVASRNSFGNRNKSTRRSLTSLEYQRRSKTIWHKPLTNAIFSSHFKESSHNKFHIEHLVAKGAFGVVFKVIDKDAQKLQLQQQKCKGESIISNDNKQLPTFIYALKVLQKSKVIEESNVQQIKNEADIQKVCGHHMFIVQQVDLWQDRHSLYILSEYVPNGELFAKFNKFSIDLVRFYLAEIALAIDFLHNAGIIYRDAKPENILLTHNFHIKLTDFGLSKWLKLSATTNTMCGTFQYMGTI